ncbi:hypothetical protein G8C92_04825 [Paenibacillus donghaensis]|uniref:hypothetical protein n=1 Tax=Paenibacillus donghaensis TaxID=414771 RepID=UPI0018843EBB|nr:hypothetical protein [Paenibacillus donghaensis]MBE9913367.1 hypothetical protein [Paenibacillus donghaensis]
MTKGITLQELDSSAIVNLIPYLGTTSNNGDAYSITTSVPIDVNQKFTIKFNAVSSTAPTLKINEGTSRPIKKANGNNAKLYASVYTLFWDGSAFILQGEGGDIQVVQGLGDDNLKGTIANLPFEPVILLILASPNVYAWSDGIYAAAQSFGHLFAFKASENDVISNDIMVSLNFNHNDYSDAVRFRSVTFGPNYINYEFSKSNPGGHYYYVLGT